MESINHQKNVRFLGDSFSQRNSSKFNKITHGEIQNKLIDYSRSFLKMDEHTIKMAMAAMSDRNSVAHEVAKRLNITTTTLYTYINGDG